MDYIKNTIAAVIILIITSPILSQIYQPEGLNMPGDWDGWTNPPTNIAFAGSSQTAGGQVRLIPLSSSIYQTIYYVNSSGGNITAGNYNFKFTSGPVSNIWQNQWGNVTISLNSIQQYTYGVAGTNEPTPNNITLTNNKWYVANWDNTGYENTSAIFMELSAQPVDITSVSQTPMLPTAADDVEVRVELSDSLSPEESIFIRYSADNWNSSQLSECNFADTTGTAIIPHYPNNTKIEYYAFSTAADNPGTHTDLVTIKYNDNGGIYYSYTVGDTLSCGTGIALMSTEPTFPLESSEVLVTFNAALGNGGLAGYHGDVYAHTGVITSESTSSSDWKYVVTEWGENTPETKLTLVDSNLYELLIPNVRDYYGVPDGEQILKMAFVFRSGEPVNGSYLEGKTSDIGDIFVDVYGNQLNVKITYPTKSAPLVEPNTPLPVCVASLQSDSIYLYIDDQLLDSTDNDNIFYALTPSNYEQGTHWLIASAVNLQDAATDSVLIFIRGNVPVAELPDSVVPGINYIDNQTVTLVLSDPAKLKKYAFVLGDFNNWTVNQESYMNRTPDGSYFWITLSGLTPGTEYAYQYYIDGQLKLADPYCDKILDPYNDKWIPDANYPNLKEYPFGSTVGNVSILETGKQDYNWIINDFTPVAVNETQSNLIIYEMLVRDFVADRRIASIIDTLDYLKTLGVNAIELMPINEFEGNDSWGYNPSFYFAADKAYGTTEDYKAFIDACHQLGIAVIMDVVLNHSFGQSPMVQMYWNKQTNEPSAQNPWYNQVAPHPLSPGYDFNHESAATKTFVKRFFNYWVTQFKIDGFRLDLSKGFTQTYSGQDVSLWSHYDQSRINILTDYYNSIKATNPNTYVILEHFSDNDEEVVLANTGMLPWGKMTEQFNQNTMGYQENSDFSWAYYNQRGYVYPNLIPFMESHDEERLMYKNLQYGNSSGNYDITDSVTALKRISAIIPMYFMVPGPKMLWQFEELGYDYSINYCGDDTVNEDCRTWSKPVRWDYWNDVNRQEIYQVMAGMAKLKTTQDAFKFGTYTKDLSALAKRAWLSYSTLDVCTGGNFDVISKTVNPNFQHTGTWYNYFTGEGIEVTNTTGYSINMEPGGYYVFTDVEFERPFLSLEVNVVWKETGTAVVGAELNLNDLGKQIIGVDGKAYFLPQLNSDYGFKLNIPNQGDTTGVISVGSENMTYTIEVGGWDYVAENNADNIKVYPNPAQNFINIYANENYKLTITDVEGKVYGKFKVAAGNQEIKLNNYKQGVFFLIFDNDKKRNFRKIVVCK